MGLNMYRKLENVLSFYRLFIFRSYAVNSLVLAPASSDLLTPLPPQWRGLSTTIKTAAYVCPLDLELSEHLD